jgi:hypothetical protein
MSWSFSKVKTETSRSYDRLGVNGKYMYICMCVCVCVYIYIYIILTSVHLLVVQCEYQGQYNRTTEAALQMGKIINTVKS